MPARRGGFSASLTPFGGGVLNLDAAYSIGGLTPTPNAPTPNAPPPLQYGGGGSPWEQELPIVGQTPVPESAVSEPVTLPTWQPVSATTAGTLNRYITNLQTSGTDPAKLAEYTARQEDYLSRGTPVGVDYSSQIAALNTYIANLSAVQNPTAAQTAKLAEYIARRDDYRSR